MTVFQDCLVSALSHITMMAISLWPANESQIRAVIINPHTGRYSLGRQSAGPVSDACTSY